MLSLHIRRPISSYAFVTVSGSREQAETSVKARSKARRRCWGTVVMSMGSSLGSAYEPSNGGYRSLLGRSVPRAVALSALGRAFPTLEACDRVLAVCIRDGKARCPGGATGSMLLAVRLIAGNRRWSSRRTSILLCTCQRSCSRRCRDNYSSRTNRRRIGHSAQRTHLMRGRTMSARSPPCGAPRTYRSGRSRIPYSCRCWPFGSRHRWLPHRRRFSRYIPRRSYTPMTGRNRHCFRRRTYQLAPYSDLGLRTGMIGGSPHVSCDALAVMPGTLAVGACLRARIGLRLGDGIADEEQQGDESRSERSHHCHILPTCCCSVVIHSRHCVKLAFHAYLY